MGWNCSGTKVLSKAKKKLKAKNRTNLRRQPSTLGFRPSCSTKTEGPNQLTYSGPTKIPSLSVPKSNRKNKTRALSSSHRAYPYSYIARHVTRDGNGREREVFSAHHQKFAKHKCAEIIFLSRQNFAPFGLCTCSIGMATFWIGNAYAPHNTPHGAKDFTLQNTRI